MSIERTQDKAGDGQSMSRRTLRGAIWSLAAQAVTALAALIVFVMMSRLVGYAELGEYMLALVCVGAVQWLALNAYREPMIQAPELSPAVRSSVFWFSVGIAIFLGIILFGIAKYLRAHGHATITASCLSLLAVKVFFDTVASVPLALCYRELKFRLLASTTIVASTFGLITSIGLLYAGWGVSAVAAAQGAVSALSFALVLSRCGWLPGLHFSRQDLMLLKNYSPHVVLWQGVEALNMYLDRFFVGTRLSLHALGVYGFARRLNDVVIEVLVGAAGNVALPTYATLQNDRAALKRAYLRSMRVVTFAVFPVIGILYGVADELVSAVFGAKWATAVPIYQCFLLLGAIQTIGVFQASLIRSLGHARLWARYQLAQAIANIVVLYFAVDHGIHILAIAVVIRTYLVWSYAVAITCQLVEIRVRDYLRGFIKPALGAVLACFVAEGVLYLAQGMPSMVVIVCAAMFGGLAYVAAALMTMKAVTNDVLALIGRRG